MSKPLTVSVLNEFFKADAKRSGLSPFPARIRKGESLASYFERYNADVDAHHQDDLGKAGRFEAFVAERESKP